MSDTPLAQALPDSLAQYFNKDPELLTEQEEMIIVQALREERKRYLVGEAAKKARPTKAAAPQTLSIEDLGDF